MSAPQHAFELKVTIGGESWDYVKQAIEEISQHIHEREPGDVGVCSGGGGGCHSIDLQRREVSPEEYRKELEEWRQKECAANRGRRIGCKMSAGAKDAAEAKPIVFAGPSEEQQQVQVEQAIKEGHLTFSLTQRSSAEKSAIT